jgi:hypothetical protein
MQKITATNLVALKSELRNGVIPARVKSTAVSHLRRCIAASLIVPGTDKGTWVLTDAGKSAITAHDAIWDKVK